MAALVTEFTELSCEEVEFPRANLYSRTLISGWRSIVMLLLRNIDRRLSFKSSRGEAVLSRMFSL
jgi:hypothetical protein